MVVLYHSNTEGLVWKTMKLDYMSLTLSLKVGALINSPSVIIFLIAWSKSSVPKVLLKYYISIKYISFLTYLVYLIVDLEAAVALPVWLPFSVS